MVSIALPFFPPSVNDAYFTKGRIRVLTKEGKKFKTEVKTYLARNCPQFLSFFTKDHAYELLFVTYFETVINKTWSPDSSVAKYKRLDASNRVKLLEDVIAEATGYDDSQNLVVSVKKAQAESTTYVLVHAWDLDRGERGPVSSYI